MNYCVYAIRSQISSKRYVGISSKTPQKRLDDHNNKRNKSTSRFTPYRLVYYELGYCKSCAIKREGFLKSGKGREFLDILE